LLAPLAEAGIVGKRADVGRRVAVVDAAGAEALLELVALGVIGVLRLLLGVQVVEVAKNSSNPWTVGKNSLRSPRWFFPNWPVA
jgi:hypothetical protein